MRKKNGFLGRTLLSSLMWSLRREALAAFWRQQGQHMRRGRWTCIRVISTYTYYLAAIVRYGAGRRHINLCALTSSRLSLDPRTDGPRSWLRQGLFSICYLKHQSPSPWSKKSLKPLLGSLTTVFSNEGSLDTFRSDLTLCVCKF